MGVKEAYKEIQRQLDEIFKMRNCVYGEERDFYEGMEIFGEDVLQILEEECPEVKEEK